MGIWTGIKHALNSTLGTDEFKPLNEIIDGQRTLAASDSVMKVLLSSDLSFSSSNKERVIGDFTPRRNGSVRVQSSLYFISSSSSITTATCTISVITNYGAPEQTTVATYAPTFSSNNSIKDTQIIDLDVEVQAGTTYTLYINMAKTVSSLHITSAKVCANIVDTSLIE